MGYKVIKFFNDLQDGKYPYNPGDPYPREGATTTDERIAELSGSNNLQGKPLIEEVRDGVKEAKKAAKKKE